MQMKVLMEKRAMPRQLMPASIPAAHSRELSVSRGDSMPDSTTCLDAPSPDASLDMSASQGHQPDESIAGDKERRQADDRYRRGFFVADCYVSYPSHHGCHCDERRRPPCLRSRSDRPQRPKIPMFKVPLHGHRRGCSPQAPFGNRSESARGMGPGFQAQERYPDNTDRPVATPHQS